jgi:hypothetical protein
MFLKKRNLVQNTDESLKIKIEDLCIPDFIKINYERAIDKIDVLAKLVQDEDINIKKFAILKLREFSMKNIDDYQINSILQKLSKYLINLISDPFVDKKIFFETSWALINFLYDFPALFLAEFKNGLLYKSFNIILNDLNTELPIINHIFWLLGNLINENTMFGFISGHVDLLKHFYNWTLNLEIIDLKYNGIIIWAFSIFSTEYLRNENNFDNLKGIVINCLSIFKKVLLINNEQAYMECFPLFRVLAKNINSHRIIIENGITPLLIVTMESTQDVNIINECLILLSQFLAGENETAEFMLNYPIINKLLETLKGCVNQIQNNNHEPIVCELIKNACVCFSNIFASGEKYIEILLNNEEFQKRINYIYMNTNNYTIAYEVLYMLQNMFVGGNLYHKSEFIKHNYHHIFFYYFQLKDNNMPDKVIIILLQSLYEFLKYGEKISNKINIIQREIENTEIHDIIDKLTLHSNEDVYSLALKIIQNYWEQDEFRYEDKSNLNY